jgi:penicillin-binding protein 1B
MERRNLVLDAMVETGAITAGAGRPRQGRAAGAGQSNLDAGEAPYFVDLVHDQLAQRISDQELGHDSLRIYTSLDPELQRAASEAVEVGMKNVDDLVRRLHKKGDTEHHVSAGGAGGAQSAHWADSGAGRRGATTASRS